MKSFYKICIVLFLALSIFVARDDIKLVLNNVSKHFETNIKNPIIKFTEKQEVQLAKKVDLPGALRVVDNLINGKTITLSKDNVIILTNKYRKENGNLEPLKENSKLDMSAENKLRDMFDKQYFEHMSPSGQGVSDLSSQAGYDYILIGENLALGNFKDDLALVDAWMASPGHRANILNRHYTEIGVAVGKGVFEGKNVWISVQHFGTPRSVCPPVDQVLYGVIDIDQTKLNTMESDLAIRREKIDKNVIFEGSTYKEQVDEYNSQIDIYNQLIIDTKQKIETYNNQVENFNTCLSGNGSI